MAGPRTILSLGEKYKKKWKLNDGKILAILK